MLIRKTLFTCCLWAASLTIAHSASLIYQEDTTHFPNPERGFYVVDKTDPTFLGEATKKGMTMVRMYYELRAYADLENIPQSYLDVLSKDAENARKAGFKIIPRFIYSRGGTSLNPPLPRILSHINQLTPTLRANSDVIAFMEAGFIGMYGEWHYAQGQPSADKIHTTPTARKSVLTELLKVMPDRMVALRYNRDKREIFGSLPLERDSAFSAKPSTRTGAHNDCFASSTNDIGTYDGAETIEWQKSYLSKDNRYVVQGGENCGGTTYTSCPIAVTDLKRMRWDVLNSAFNLGSLAKWESEGCLGTMKKHLGYRIKLKSAQLQDAVRPGHLFAGTFHFTQLGWGKIYNARGCELVFRNTSTQSKFAVPVATDPRQWFLTDTSATLNLAATIPAATPEGSYQVYLNLPDTASRLKSKPAFSIRLANTGVWEDSTGYNSLLHSLTVSKTASGIHPGMLTRQASKFAFFGQRKSDIFTFTLQSREKALVRLDVLGLKGNRLFSTTQTLDAHTLRTISWTPPSNAAYLVRISQEDQDKNQNQGPYQEMHMIF